jgi:Sigma-70 region 2
MFARVVDIGVYMDDLDRRRRVETLFAQHSAAVRAYAARRVPSATADDVVSDVFVVAWRRLDDVPDDGLPWLLAESVRDAIAPPSPPPGGGRGPCRSDSIRPNGGSAMTDLLERLAAANPVPEAERPPIEDLWQKVSELDAQPRRGRGVHRLRAGRRIGRAVFAASVPWWRSTRGPARSG